MFTCFDTIHERDGQTDRRTLHDDSDVTPTCDKNNILACIHIFITSSSKLHAKGGWARLWYPAEVVDARRQDIAACVSSQLEFTLRAWLDRRWSQCDCSQLCQTRPALPDAQSTFLCFPLFLAFFCSTACQILLAETMHPIKTECRKSELGSPYVRLYGQSW